LSLECLPSKHKALSSNSMKKHSHTLHKDGTVLGKTLLGGFKVQTSQSVLTQMWLALTVHLGRVV
jgi:hypothetical protein